MCIYIYICKCGCPSSFDCWLRRRTSRGLPSAAGCICTPSGGSFGMSPEETNIINLGIWLCFHQLTILLERKPDV